MSRRRPGEDLTMAYIPAATVKPVVTVKETDTLEYARTQMELHDFSQLPVVMGRKSTGIISWQSIGRALVQNADACLLDCIDRNYTIVDLTDDLLSAIPHINRDGYVVVVTHEQRISGIVTGADLGDALSEIAGPFILLERLEERLREILVHLRNANSLNEDDIRVALPPGSRDPGRKAAEFTLGELSTVITSPHVWPRVSSSYDRKLILQALARATTFRNTLMHFREQTKEHDESSLKLPQLVEMIAAVCAELKVD